MCVLGCFTLQQLKDYGGQSTPYPYYPGRFTEGGVVEPRELSDALLAHCAYLPDETEGARLARFYCQSLPASLGMDVEAIHRWDLPWAEKDDGPPVTEWTRWHPFTAPEEGASLSAARRLFDVATDPNEEHDLAGRSTLITAQAQLEARLAHFRSLAGQPQPEARWDVHGKELWTQVGGVVPYTDYATPPPKPSIAGVAAARAPHLLFLLTDDQGHNDFGFRSSYLPFTSPHLEALREAGVTLSNYYTARLCGPARSALLTGRYPLRTGYWAAPLGGHYVRR